jgi:hypothetical protein
MKIQLTLGHTEERSKNVNAGQCINMHPVVNTGDSKNTITLSNTGGLQRWALLKVAEVRGLFRYLNTLYAVAGDSLYSITMSTATATLLGTINSSTGRVWMEYNANGQLGISDGERLYVYDGSITSVDDAGAFYYVDNYGFFNEPNSGRIWNTNLNNFKIVTGTDFVTEEGAIDNILTIIADHREIWALGEYTIGIYKTSGDPDAVIQRIDGSFQEIGINAPSSAAKQENVIFWLDNTLQVRMAEAYHTSVISTPAISWQIANLSTTDDAVGFTYVQDGHTFYVLTFPTGNLTLVYDLGESLKLGKPLWHTRQSYNTEQANRWRGNCALTHNNAVYIGDYNNGYIYKLDRDTYTDNETTIKRIFTTQRIYDPNDRNELFHHELEIEVESGIGLDGSGQGTDPEIMMEYSDDGGHTWSDENWKKLGQIGEYEYRAWWHILGASRDRIYRFSVTDPVNLEVIGGYVKATLGTD